MDAHLQGGSSDPLVRLGDEGQRPPTEAPSINKDPGSRAGSRGVL